MNNPEYSAGSTQSSSHGFPVVLPSDSGLRTHFLSVPPLLSHFPGDQIGLAIYNDAHKPICGWGILSIPEPGQDQDPNRIANGLDTLLEHCISNKSAVVLAGDIQLMGQRQPTSTVVLAFRVPTFTNTRAALQTSEKETLALRRIGKALSMHHTLQPLCMMSAHAILPSLDLAGVVIWAKNDPTSTPELLAHAGLNHKKTDTFSILRKSRTPQHLAERVYQSGRPEYVVDVWQHPLTSSNVANSCQTRPGASAALPLRIDKKTVGVIQLIAKSKDTEFLKASELHNTIAEHLAFAVQSAALFEQAEKLATTDPLTGIPNHRTLQEFLDRKFNESVRTGKPVAVAMIDVDHFRQFNETEGHDAGDRVLKLVAKAIQKAVPESGLAARYGGEEFTIVIPGFTAAQAKEICEHARQSIKNIEYIDAQGIQKPISASLGVASFPSHGRDPQSVLKSADLALYRAKRQGRDQVVVFDPIKHSEAPPEEGKPVADESHIHGLSRYLQLTYADQDTITRAAALRPLFRAKPNTPLPEWLSHDRLNILAWTLLQNTPLAIPSNPMILPIASQILLTLEAEPTLLGRFDPRIQDFLARHGNAA